MVTSFSAVKRKISFIASFLLLFSVILSFPSPSGAAIVRPTDEVVPDPTTIDTTDTSAANPLWGNQDLTYLQGLPEDAYSPDLVQEFQTIPTLFPICDPLIDPYSDPYDGYDLPVNGIIHPPIIHPPYRCFPRPIPIFTRTDLAVTKQADRSAVNVGETVNYTITYHNNGPDFAYAVLLSDQYDSSRMSLNDSSLPAGCFDAGRLGGGGYITCRFFELLQPGQSRSITYSAVASATGSATNTVRVYSFKTIDTNLTNNISSATVNITSGTPTSADLSLTESVNVTNVALGGNVQYTLSYANNGPTSATNVSIFDDYDENVISAISGLTSPCVVETTVSGKRIRCDLGTLTAGQRGTITYTASTAGAQYGLMRNLSSISSNIPDPNTANNNAVVSLQITKPVAPGDIVFNEMMWMGSSAGTTDEWLELRNITPFSVDMSRLVLTQRVSATTEQVLAIIPTGTLLNPYGHYLISSHAAPAKTATSLAVQPDLVEPAFTLNDTNLQLKLYQFNFKLTLPAVSSMMNAGSFPSLVTLDIADDGSGAPLAGSNGAVKASMIRKWNAGDGTLSGSWITAGVDETRGFNAGATDRGTPGIGNFPKLIVSAMPQGGEQVVLQNEYGDMISSFIGFKSGTADGVNFSVGDTDRDSSGEIVATKNNGGNQVVQDLFDGTRLLLNGRDFFSAPNSASGLNVATCDFDKSGFKDYVVLGKKNNGNQVLVYKRNGTFVRSFTAFSKGSGVEVSCGDLDNDKADEIVVGKGSGGTEAVLYKADGTRIRYFTTFSKGSGMNVAVADLEGDGNAEIIIGKKTGGREIVLYRPNGTLIRYFVSGLPGGDGTKVGTIDLDNNGKKEIIAARNSGSNQIYLLKPDGTLIRNFTSSAGSNGLNVGGGDIIIP